MRHNMNRFFHFAFFSGKAPIILRVLIFSVCIWVVFWCGALFSYNQSFRCEVNRMRLDIRVLESYSSGTESLGLYLASKKSSLEFFENAEKEMAFWHYFISPIVLPVGLYDLSRVCSYQPEERRNMEQ